MYSELTIQDISFLILYGGVSVLAVLAALYLLLRRTNAFVPTVHSPRVLRRWTAAFFLAMAGSHVWWLVLGTVWLADDRLVRNLIVILLDHVTLIPLAMAVLLAMLQDRRRSLGPWLAVELSVVVMTVMGMVRHDWFLGYEVAHYCQLAVIAVVVAYYVVALRQYERWLLDNYSDLEHKQVWQSLVVAIVLLVFYEIYTSNAGATYREYLAQMLSMAFIAFFLWRVETLQRLYAQAASIGQWVTARQLAEQCGFRSYNTFSTAFKQLRGVSMTAWMNREDTQN